MADAMIAALDGAAEFEAERVSASAARVWPKAVYTAYSGQLAQAADGQLELGDADGHTLFVVFLGRSGMSVEGDDGMAAQFIAWLADEHNFPDDGRVLVTDWATEMMPIAAGVTAQLLLDLRAS